MTALPDLDFELADLPEISTAAYEKIDRWRDALDQTPQIDKRSTFEAAAADLYGEAQHETDLAAYQSIEDAIRILGREHAGLDPDDIDFVMIGAKFSAGVARDHDDARSSHAAISDPPPAGPEDYSTDPTPAQPIAASFITPAAWPNEAPPPVDWLVAGRIPRGEVTLFAGDGGVGKTDAASQLAANVARQAPEWFGHEIASGPVVFVSAEEPEREIQRRLFWLGKRDGYGNGDLDNLHQWFPDKSGDCVMAIADRSGIMRPTPLMLSIKAAIERIAPVCVIVDNVAATFAGNQNDRVAARTYVNLWRSIARGPGLPAVLLLDHPSLSGLTSGTGRGGNMDWWNAVRGVLLLRIPDDKAEADLGIRVIETGKSNYAKRGNPLRLVWTDGGLSIERQPSPLHRQAKDAECAETFLRLLDERNAQGRYVSDKSGKNYAPAVFADMSGNGAFTAKPFARAMDRLFETRKIALRTERVDGKSRNVIDRASAAPPSASA